jgi:hypothetical protein
VAQIELPKYCVGEAANVSKLLEQITKWHTTNNIVGADTHRRVWYRGHEDESYLLWPGVYRDDFTACAATMYGKDGEGKRLNLEREMLSEFRTSGATLLDPNAIVETYFIAQHYGMPTRLLDWTTNPLAAFFFAVNDADKKTDGDVLVMDAPKLLPTPAKKDSGQPIGIITMRHPYATDAIGLSFWHEPKTKRQPLIVPIRPDNRAGRIGQQSSCFTLHTHSSAPCQNPTLGRIRVPACAKKTIRDELRRLNINEFSIYNDLDHLSREIKRARGLLK